MIKLTNIWKAYGGRQVIRELSLQIPEGKTTVLIGSSGCGKTTLLEMINGMVRPEEGEITIGGRNLRQSDLISLRRRIGYVIQEIGLFPHYTVFRNIALVPTLLKWNQERIRERVTEMMRLVNLPAEKMNAFPHQLSGGQRQRVGVARALAANPQILLMDEPFGAIDPINRKRLQDEFLAIQQKLKKTVVFVTHDMDEALKLGDVIAVMNEGSIVQSGPAAELILHPANEFVRQFVSGDNIGKALSNLPVKTALNPLKKMDTEASDGDRLQWESDAPDVLWVTDRDRTYLGRIWRKNFSAAGQVNDEAIEWLPPLRPGDNFGAVFPNLLMNSHQALPVIDANGILQGEVLLNSLRALVRAMVRQREVGGIE